jgi:hypothetical protein
VATLAHAPEKRVGSIRTDTCYRSPWPSMGAGWMPLRQRRDAAGACSPLTPRKETDTPAANDASLTKLHKSHAKRQQRNCHSTISFAKNENFKFFYFQFV